MTVKAGSEEQPARLSLRERNRLRTRRELLDGALEVFAESGFGSATVENIAARAGASKVTLYAYFPDGREELFRELYEEVNNELIDRITEVYKGDGDFVSHVVEATSALLDIAQRPLIGRFYSIDDPALDQALTPVRGHASRVCAEFISADLAAGQAAGTVKTHVSPEAIGELLVGAMGSALSEVARGRTSPSDILAAIKALAGGL